MSRYFNRFLLGLGAILLCAGSLYAQKDRQSLERKKSELKKDIEYKNKLLKETEQSKSKSVNQLVIINKKITNREKLISALREEVDLIDSDIDNTNNLISAKEDELKALKDEYAQMIYYAYKTRSTYDKIMFVFASESVNQAYKRLKYLQQYSYYRKRQAEAITEARNVLNETRKELEEKKIEKENTIRSAEKERNNLDVDRNEKQKVLTTLSSKEKELRDEIKKKEKEAQKLQAAIQRIIEEEMRKRKKNSKGEYVLTPEAKALSNSFAQNKGKLPWPTQKGVVTDYFGEHWHPVLKGIKIKNNGVDISTEKGATARAIFEGEVSRVIVIPGMGKAIMVRHGEYISVYSNLQDVFVQKGDKVTTKQDIGLVMTDEGKGKTEVHFEIWKGQTTQNPAHWLYEFK